MIDKEELLNSKDFYKSFKNGEDLTSFFKQMHKRAVEHMLEAELDAHLDNEKVNITIKRKVEKEGDIAKIKFLCESDSDHNKHLKEIYNSRLKEFLKENYDYSLIWSIEYHFDIEKGIMLFCQSKIKERTSSNYIHSMEHKIELI